MLERERLNLAPSSFPVAQVNVPGRQPRPIQSQCRSLLTILKGPKCIAMIGVILLLAGVATVVIGSQVSESVPNSAVDMSRNREGVPLAGLYDRLPVKYDCKSDINDFEAYGGAVKRAETNLFGSSVSNLTTLDMEGFLGDLPEISVNLTFWIFHARSDTREISVERLVSLQVAALQKAYAGSNIKFFLEGSGIHHVYVDDNVEVNCYDKVYTREFIQKMNSFSSVAIVVCTLEEINGISGILGDAYQAQNDYLYLKEDGQSLLGVIYINPSTLEDFHTTLIHQMGHLFGVGHPYPRYETCKIDGDLIIDTEMIYHPSNSCVLQESSLCHPERLAVLQYSPGKLYMDISPDDCRDRFTPGQILRMHAMLSEAIQSGARYATFNGSANTIRTLKGAFYQATQNGFPGFEKLENQMNLYFHGLDSSMIKARLLGYSNSFSSLSEYAMMAIRDDISTSSFSCISTSKSKNSSGFWVGELNFNAQIQGIYITLEESMTPLSLRENSPFVLLQVGDSYKEEVLMRNCTSSFVTLKSLSQAILCDSIISGSFIKLVFKDTSSQEVCIRKIDLLSKSEDSENERIQSGPNPIANIGEPKQTSTLNGLVADNAIAASSDGLHGKCSATLPETNAGWGLHFRSPHLINAVSFDVAACPFQMSKLESNSAIIKNAARLLEQCTTNGKIPLKVTVLGEDGDPVCTSRINSAEGSFHLVECGTLVKGSSIRIEHVGSTGQSLAICNFRVRGFPIVSLLQQSILTMQDVFLGGDEMNGDFLAPIDNDLNSCIRAKPSKGDVKYWKAHLKEPINIYAIILNGHGKNLMAKLSDDAGRELWTSEASRNGTIATTYDGVISSILTISGFERLCEVVIGIDTNE